MSFMLIAGGIALGTLLLSYLRSGRFGATALALGAGYLLTLLWADTLTAKAIQLPFLSWHNAVYSGLVLLPGLLTLIFSHKQKGFLPRIVAALILSVFVIALLLPMFNPEPITQMAYDTVEHYREVIISGVLALGLLDMIFSRSPKPPKHSKD